MKVLDWVLVSFSVLNFLIVWWSGINLMSKFGESFFEKACAPLLVRRLFIFSFIPCLLVVWRVWG